MSGSTQQIIIRTLFSLLFFGFLSCEEAHDEAGLMVSDQTYFPLNPQTEWHYQRWLDFDSSGDNPGFLFGTLVLTVKGDVIVEGKIYKEITVDPSGARIIVRREGSKYFARLHELYQNDFSHEYVFLDTKKRVGESWSYLKDGGVSRTDYVIHKKYATHTIHDVTYRDVIEVHVNYYHLMEHGKFEKHATVIHYYAKGVGEIYHFYPYPTAAYGDLSGFLVQMKK